MIIKKGALCGIARLTMCARPPVFSGKPDFAFLVNYARSALLRGGLYVFPGFCSVRVLHSYQLLKPLVQRFSPNMVGRQFRVLPSLVMMGEVAEAVHTLRCGVSSSFTSRLVFKRARASSRVISRGPMARKKQSRLQFSIVRRHSVLLAAGNALSVGNFFMIKSWLAGVRGVRPLLAYTHGLGRMATPVFVPVVITRSCAMSLLPALLLED